VALSRHDRHGRRSTAIQQKITPYLWFDGNAEAAVNFYITILKDPKIVTRSHYGDAGPGPKGSVMAIAFRLEGEQAGILSGSLSLKRNP